MANFEISLNPEYTEQIRKFETKDPAHADLFNAVIGALLNNDVFLKLAIDAAFRQGTGYTDQKIADLINGAPETLNTLGEIAEAMKNNSDVVDALNAAIGTKASQAEVDGHIGNGTIHIKASERQNWNEKQTKTGDAQDNIVTFESGDAIEPTGWANVALVTTKEKMSSLMRKFSLTLKNVRYLFGLIGNNKLSVGDGTITGAINALNTGLFGGRTYATYNPSNPRLALKTVVLPEASGRHDSNNYFVSVTMESETDAAYAVSFTEKHTGAFNVYFRRNDGSDWSENTAVWFSYTVVINR